MNKLLTARRLTTLAIFAISTLMSCQSKTLPNVDIKLENSYARTEGKHLVVGTGAIERKWILSDNGLSTSQIKNSLTEYVWQPTNKEAKCDWSIVGLTEQQAELKGITATISNDNNFTSQHICVIAEIYYPHTETTIKYQIWAYPNAPGIRTQLFVKGEPSLSNTAKQSSDNGVTFKLIRGTNKSNYEANGVAPRHLSTTIEDSSNIEIQASGLDINKKYKIGLNLWNFAVVGALQDITITSVDGENKSKIANSIEVPNYKKNGDFAKNLLLDIPMEVLLDDSCRIIITSESEHTSVAEICIYEESDIKYIINGDVERVENLVKDVPQGYTLAGYYNCGDRDSGAKIQHNGYVEHIGIDATQLNRHYIGYFNDTQHRNSHDTPLIRTTTKSNSVDTESVNWASIMSLYDSADNGLMIVKESHKCVNSHGVDTGDFAISKDGIFNSGLGLNISDINRDEFKWLWASWSIVYSGNEADRQLALKRFDRARFPIDATRDIYIQANTWGSDRGRLAAKEDNILVELDVQSELGVDIQQIDDGWQNNNKEWLLRDDWYPEGWSRVRRKAQESGVKLGLWGAAMPISLDDLKRTYDEGNFVSYKLDFASLGNHKNMNALMNKVREFIEYTDHSVRVNWDLTENAPRFGYFWAKEYGCIYLENRKPNTPQNVIYVPYLVLRDCWHLAQYTNINKFQTTIQNVAMTSKVHSDAGKHSQAYATAIGLSGVPLLFMETHFLSQESRDTMRNIFAKYKEHRNNMFHSYVFAIGNTPDNRSWSGFQYISESGEKEGYILLFRELHNKNKRESIKLEFLTEGEYNLIDVMNGDSSKLIIDSDGHANFEISQSGDFRLYRYIIE